jgi:hypothetical protein
MILLLIIKAYFLAGGDDGTMYIPSSTISKNNPVNQKDKKQYY